MANTIIQLKRSSVAGKQPNTSTLSIGELAINITDKKLYSSDGTNIFEPAANVSNQRITNSLTLDNDKNIYFRTVNASASVGFRQQSDDNFVMYSTNTTYGQRAVWSIFANSITSAFSLSVPTIFNANVNLGQVALIANNNTGTAGQVLTTNGSSTYWSTVSGGGGSVNTSAQYTWTNTHTFQANINFTGNNITVVSNTGSVMFGGAGDTNWRIGRSTGSTTKFFYSNNTLDILAAASNLEGVVIGQPGGNTYLETGYAGTFTRNPIYVGNSSVNVSINSTAFTGTSNNASFLGGIAAASYVQNTDSRTLSGNLNFTGTNTVITTNFTVVNSTANVVYFASNGNLGIGNSTPTSTLSINQGAVVNKPAFVIHNIGAGDSGIAVGAMTIGYQQDWGRLTALRVTNKSLAYVHAGIANAQQGAHRFSTDGTGGTNLGANGSVVDVLAPTTASNIFQLRQADETRVFNVAYNGDLWVTGNTGIGNTTPNAKLQVTGTANVSGNVAIGGISTFNANVVLGSVGLSSNGSFGTAGHVLHSNGTATYWAVDDNSGGTVTSVATGSGLTGGTITTTGTVSVLANTGIVANATGVYVNATYIGTISANNASFLGGTAAASYVQNTDSRTLSGNLVFSGANVFFQSATLGGTATNFVNNFIFYTQAGDNASYVRFYHNRHTTGSNWTGVSTRIQQRIDATDMGYVEFNPSGYTHGISLYGGSGYGLTVSQTGQSIFGNTVFLGSVGLSANGSLGTAGHVLHSNGSATYWATDDNSGTVTSVATGNGMTGGTITTTGTISVLANTGIVANATGLYVNSTYIGTLSANNASFLGGVAAANYLRTDASKDVTESIFIRFGSANQTDGNDGKIGAGLFSNGLNIVGTQTQTGQGREISYYGTLKDRSSLGAVFGGTVFVGANVSATVSTITVGNSTVNTAVTAGVVGRTDVIDTFISNTTATVTQTAIDAFSATTFRSGKYIIQATNGANYHYTEVSVVHDGTTAYATEFATMFTGSSLVSFAVDISGGNVRLLATAANATTTTYKIDRKLIKV
jgi:hypothetical protein